MNMIALTLAACLFTAPGQDGISVHEWGVVIYSGDTALAKGASGGPWDDPAETVCFAPVLYFYGPDFTGDVTVCALGRIFSTWPAPDQAGPAGIFGGLGSAIRWSITAFSDDALSQQAWRTTDTQIADFDRAMEYWRLPRSLLVSRQSDSYLDRFLYYEVDLSGTGFPLTLPGFAPEGTAQEYLVTGQVLLFKRLETGGISLTLVPGDSVAFHAEGSSRCFENYSCETVTAVLQEWAGGILTDDEIQAMWNTWEPFVLYGDWEGECLAVFPLPEPLIARISTILVTNDSGLPVEYSRFFLGMKTL